MRNNKIILMLAIVMAAVGIVDNASTILAIERGASETNPLVMLFLWDPVIFASFTVAKAFAMFYLVYRYMRLDVLSIAIYAIVLMVFLRAIVINLANAGVL